MKDLQKSQRPMPPDIILPTRSLHRDRTGYKVTLFVNGSSQSVNPNVRADAAALN